MPAISSCGSAAPSGIRGPNVGIGKDHTLFALIDGHIEYRTKAKGRVYVSVVPMQAAAE